MVATELPAVVEVVAAVDMTMSQVLAEPQAAQTEDEAETVLGVLCSPRF